ncbi:hypothetical protein FJ945_27815 [Mesorhizobium sp. B2-4-9]|nr:hypothetical protein FJ945_27815 [Mesorhizobium sp. B2-4-9]
MLLNKILTVDFRACAVKRQPAQAVETAEVIHMHVRHEDVRNPQEFAQRKRRKLSEIEKDGPVAEAEIQ